MRWPEIDPDPDGLLWCDPWEILFYAVMVAASILIGGSYVNKKAEAPAQAGRVDASGQCPGMGSGKDLVPKVGGQDGVEADGSGGDSEVP